MPKKTTTKMLPWFRKYKRIGDQERFQGDGPLDMSYKRAMESVLIPGN
jgi:hypothetical protein